MEKYVNLGGGIFLGGAKKRREEKRRREININIWKKEKQNVLYKG